MIERYALSPMKELWTLEAQYARWLRVELAALRAMETMGEVPEGTSTAVAQAVHVDVDAFLAEEATIGHDLLAFVRVLERQAGGPGRFLHRGLTSSDIKDTALSLALRDAADLLAAACDRLLESLARRAAAHKELLMIGRTHGMHAQPTTLGLKFHAWREAVRRARQRLGTARDAVAVGKLSGPVGTYPFASAESEAAACELLGLIPATGVTQVVPRDLHADLLYALVGIAGAAETIALEVRHLSRTEVGEIEEPRPEGSSSMPHKRNPITSERICGLARVLRGHLVAQLESVALWHERDMSHSSVERIVLPDSMIVVHYILERLRAVVDGLVVHEETIAANLAGASDTVHSQAYLYALVEAGMTREAAHDALRAAAAHAQALGTPLARQLSEDARRGAVPAVHVPLDALEERLRATSRRIIDASSSEDPA